MIARTWTGYAARRDADAYRKHLLHTVRPKLQGLAGFRGLYLLRRHTVEEVEYQVLTLWDSLDAVVAFAGNEPSHAVVEPAARAVLLRFDSEVRHFEVLASPDNSGVTYG